MNTEKRFGKRLKELNKRIKFKVAILLTVIGFLVTNVVTFEGLRTHDLEATLSAEMIAYDADLRQRDKEIESILPDTLEAPLLTYPHNRASLIADYINLQWREGRQQGIAREYTIELITPDAHGAPDLANPVFRPATDVVHSTTTVRTERPGWYLWRVKRGTDIQSDKDWSTFFSFRRFSSSKERIQSTHVLTIGTFLAPPQPVLACSDSNTDASQLPFDNVLIHEICQKLASKLGFDRIRFIKFPTPETLVYSGVKDGNVDIGINALSATQARRERGVLFTREYLPNHLVLAGRLKDIAKPQNSGERIGVVRGGTNAEFAHEISRRSNISIAEAASLEELLRMLVSKEVNYILVDEPIIDQYIGRDIQLVDHPVTGVEGLIASFTMPTAVADARAGLAVAVHDQGLRDEIDQILTSQVLAQVNSELHHHD